MKTFRVVRWLLLIGTSVAATACAAPAPKDRESLGKAHAALYVDSQQQASADKDGAHSDVSIVSPTAGSTHGLACSYSIVTTSSGERRLAIGHSTNFGSTWTKSIVEVLDPNSGNPIDITMLAASATGRVGESAVVIGGTDEGAGQPTLPTVWLLRFDSCTDGAPVPINVWPDAVPGPAEEYGNTITTIRDVAIAPHNDVPGMVIVGWIRVDEHERSFIRYRRVNFNNSPAVGYGWPPFEVAGSEGASTLATTWTPEAEAFVWAAADDPERDLIKEAQDCEFAGDDHAKERVHYRWTLGTSGSSFLLQTDDDFRLCLKGANDVVIGNAPRPRAVFVKRSTGPGAAIAFAYNRSDPDAGGDMGTFTSRSGYASGAFSTFVETKVDLPCFFDSELDEVVCPDPAQYHDVGVGLTGWERTYDGALIFAASTMRLSTNGQIRPIGVAFDDLDLSTPPESGWFLGSSHEPAAGTNLRGGIVDTAHLRNYSARSMLTGWVDMSDPSHPSQIHTQYATPY